MNNLRIVSAQVTSSSSIDIRFTEYLTTNLVTSNVSITSELLGVPDSEVLKISVNKDILTVTCQPLTQLISYYIKFKSIASYPFISLNGDAIIIEDNISNSYLISGPIEPNNPVKDYLTNFLRDNIYNIDDDQTVVSKYVKSLAIILSKALYDIRQIKNENYLSFTVVNEKKIRGEGPFDRLNEEGAYEILRVGRAPSSSNGFDSFKLDNFPSFPITLQKVVAEEQLKVNSIDDPGNFNVNTLILNLTKHPVTKVNSIIFYLSTEAQVYTYDIEKLGYQIKDYRYDQDYAFTYVQLKDNQIKVNEQILNDPLFSINKIIRIDVSYEYKNLGKIINSDTLEVYTVMDSIRETLPPIINIFDLKYAPITDQDGNICTINGITFINPNSIESFHPAFISEIPFRLNALPSSIGQYTIDYSVGRVYVFGSDISNDGTGPYPPLATYKYKHTYKSQQDYVYDSDLYDLVALPKGSLIDYSGVAYFNYEEVLVPGVDYDAQLHLENLEERIENNILALNAIKTQNSPITNVFRIYNETSGEIYTIDRWNNNKIYFRYNSPPTILQLTHERATFKTISNELLFINKEIVNDDGYKVFKILLNNNTIVSSTEDTLGSSFNTSVIFSNNNVFVNELWFSKQDEATELNRLNTVGQYIIDYNNGIIYVAVTGPSLPDTTPADIGAISYKKNDMSPAFTHVVSTDDIYYQIDLLNSKNKSFSYTSFGENSIVPEILLPSDELFLNDSDSIYQLYNSKVGVFLDSSFVDGVTNQVKFVRGVYEYNDLINNINPLNFANVSSGSGYSIQVNSISKQIFGRVQYDDGYFIIIDENIKYLSPYILYNFSVIRRTDSKQLWNSTGTIILGDNLRLNLSGINNPNEGDFVSISYTFTINDLSRLVVDYNKGDFYVDYTYLADEIIISYEYGDNVIDFRTSKTIPSGTSYYASYKAGALRDALLNNFGMLVNLPELTKFDIDFDRERYREALMAALSSFIQGPTVSAIKNIGKTISHIEPEVIESAFQNWSLGSSLLNFQDITTTGDVQLLPAKFNTGVLIDSCKTVTFPLTSNIRLEDGTFETWIIPQWDGLDNDAELKFTILQNDSPIDPLKIFIGAEEYHPQSNIITLTKDKAQGTPSKNKDGIFIYYDKDVSGLFDRWYFCISDGYVDSYVYSYKINITSTGLFYDVTNANTISMFTGRNKINFTADSILKDQVVLTFLSDTQHYLLDFGKSDTKNRISIFKNESGYLIFRVLDKFGDFYSVSADVSNWKNNEPHHIAASWKINTLNYRDEIHLFIDGFEVPNIVKSNKKYSEIDPNSVIGVANKYIVSSIDLHTTLGSNLVSSSINFSSYNIVSGDIIYIDEVDFSSYTILNVNGQTLELNTVMPKTLTDARFSVNRTTYAIKADAEIYSNIAISAIHPISEGYATGISGSNIITITTATIAVGNLLSISGQPIFVVSQVSGTSITLDKKLISDVSNIKFYIYSNIDNEIPGMRALRPAYTLSHDNNHNNILIISDAIKANDLIVMKTFGLRHEKVDKKYYVWSDQQENIIMTRLPAPICLADVKINKIILPETFIGDSNSAFIEINGSDIFQSHNLPAYNPSNSEFGRTLSATIQGKNTDFSFPVEVTINGLYDIYTINDTITFTDYGTKDFAHQFLKVNYITVNVKPINPFGNALNIMIKEKYPITQSENSELSPRIKYSYTIGGGETLRSDGYNDRIDYIGGDGYIVQDDNNLFSQADIGNYLVIHAPYEVAGYYRILSVYPDRKSLLIKALEASYDLPLDPFSHGRYTIYNVKTYRSGFQNGFFIFEPDDMLNLGYLLSRGFYEVEYYTYANMKMDPLNCKVYLGSDLYGQNQIDAVVDQVKIYSTMLTDTRVGESIPANQKSITKDFNSLKALEKDNNTLALINFDSLPFYNAADIYINSSVEKKYFHSPIVINENFGTSLVILDKPLIINNDGVLDTRKEATIEFWINPIFDTGNDPNRRYYVDAYCATIIETVSVDETSVKISNPASQILSVRLKGDPSNKDYFAGGKIEVDTQNATAEIVTPTNITTNSVKVSEKVFQVITVKIVGDFTETDYFNDGFILSDQKTIYLNKPLPCTNKNLIVTYRTVKNNNNKLNTQVIRLNRRLPYHKSNVIIDYIPKGFQGDRISIFKDKGTIINFSHNLYEQDDLFEHNYSKYGDFLYFNIHASGNDFTVKAPIYWSRDTWHRVKVSYKINNGSHNDEMRLFVDGYQYNTMGTLDDGYFIDGYAIENIQFKDSINDIFIGTQYNKQDPMFSLIDNLRISNISRPLYAPYGEPIDINYSKNLSVVFPVTEDLYTTYLLNFDDIKTLYEDFAILKNRKTGMFDFSVNIFDSFGIVSSSPKVKEILEKLIKVLKPANSKVLIEYL